MYSFSTKKSLRNTHKTCWLQL